MTDFPRLIAALTDAGVDYVIVGGVAATVHGSARLTQDLDIVYGRTAENLRRLAAALAPFSPYPRGSPAGLPFQWDEATLSRGLNFTLTTSIGDIDLLGEIAGGRRYVDLVGHTIGVEMFGKNCRCLDLPTLIGAKRAAGRRRDLETVAELEALLEERSRSDATDPDSP